MKPDDKFDVSNIMNEIEKHNVQGNFSTSEGAKKGAGASIDKSIVGPYKKVDVSPTADAAKKGTGATNDFAKISKLAADHSLSVSFGD